jgi:hypothetical protein
MFSLSYTAGEHLAHELAKTDAPEDAVIRVVVEHGQFGLEIGTVQPGDMTLLSRGKIHTFHRRDYFRIARRQEA